MLGQNRLFLSFFEQNANLFNFFHILTVLAAPTALRVFVFGKQYRVLFSWLKKCWGSWGSWGKPGFKNQILIIFSFSQSKFFTPDICKKSFRQTSRYGNS